MITHSGRRRKRKPQKGVEEAETRRLLTDVAGNYSTNATTTSQAGEKKTKSKNITRGGKKEKSVKVADILNTLSLFK